MISVFLMLNTEKVIFFFFEKVILKDVQILFFLPGSYKKHVWYVEAKSWGRSNKEKAALCQTHTQEGTKPN